MAAKIVYSPEAVDHLAALSKNEQVLVVDQVERTLVDQPTTPSRKRKYLRPNTIAKWVLRLGELRVFYDVTVEALDQAAVGETTVTVKAVGKKIHNALWIADVRIDL